MFMHEMQATTKQNVQFRRALMDRPTTMRHPAKARASSGITEPMMMKNHPNSAGGGGTDLGHGGIEPDPADFRGSKAKHPFLAAIRFDFRRRNG